MVEEKNSSRGQAKSFGGNNSRSDMYAAKRKNQSAEYDENLDDEFSQSMYYDNIESAESDNNESGKTSSKTPLPNPWWVLLHLLINPKMGWRKLKKIPYQRDDFARVVFYPLLAVLAVSRFVDLLYYNEVSIAPLLQQAIAGFVSFFGGYFLVGMLARSFLPTQARTKIVKRFGQIYIMSIMSVLVMCGILSELLPWLGMLLTVPPIYCCYILAKGIKCLRIPERETMPTMVLMIVLCLGIPIAIYVLLTSLMPSA